ncbi:MAG TPA: type 4a pilus biogenesis protein PilO [Thiobacillaceae bacterium]|nr:type 4a pilus biogenesis protein PilO [Thiobacillaceae bacterium]HNU63725.1 type 4a pilus biogenesis protein PilO [Thiobacillaceae bacterium]
MNWSDLKNLDLKDIVSAPAPVRVVLIALLCIGIVALGWYLVWSDGFSQIETAKQEEATLRESFTRKKVQAFHYDTYKRRLVEIEQSLASLLRQLPNRSEMDALLTDINQVGVTKGLEFELFRPGAETPAEFYATLPVNIRVLGSYADIGGFVNDLAQLPRIVTLHDISLMPTKDGGPLTMEARVQTYRYLDENEMAAQRQKQKDGKK